MKISIICSRIPLSYELKRIYEEAKNFSNVNFFYYDDLNFPNYIENLDSDIYYIFRHEPLHVHPSDFYFIAKQINDNGKIVIDKSYLHIPLLDKIYIYKYLYKNKLPVPKTIRSLKLNLESNFNYIKNNLNFPIIVKHPHLHRGKFVKLIKNEKQLIDFLSKYKKYISILLFQEYINYVKDLRIIFIGEPIGVMQRVNKKDYRANISRGGYGLKLDLNEELKEIAYKISEKFNMQIFAFDVLIDNEDRKYIIDLHRVFQFKGFEQYLNINVARKILEYLNSLKA